MEDKKVNYLFLLIHKENYFFNLNCIIYSNTEFFKI